MGNYILIFIRTRFNIQLMLSSRSKLMSLNLEPSGIYISVPEGSFRVGAEKNSFINGITISGNSELFPFLSVLLLPRSSLRILMPSLASCGATASVHSESANVEASIRSQRFLTASWMLKLSSGKSDRFKAITCQPCDSSFRVDSNKFITNSCTCRMDVFFAITQEIIRGFYLAAS